MIIGIDLGTTNSLVAIWRDGKAASPLPINILKRALESIWSTAPSVTGSRRRVSGFIVVSHSCSAFISPRPLKREIAHAPCLTPSLRSLSSMATSSPSSSA